MITLSQDWIRRFQQFSMTLDSVDGELFENVKDVVETYATRTLGACFFRVLLDGFSVQTDEGDEPALSTIWSSGKGKMGDVQISDAEGNCTSQTTYAYQRRRRLWITDRDGDRLAQWSQASDRLVEHWVNAVDLPPYKDYGEGRARTSVILPLEYGERIFGVMDLEFRAHLTPSERAKSSLGALAGSLARIVWLYETHRTKLEDTRDALRELQSGYVVKESPLEVNRVFLATSSRADPAVTEVLESVLNEFDGVFEVEYWRGMRSSGSISEQVRASIAGSDFGVC